ncbi:MAG: hypothetical protein EOM20_02650 [Spartobacteria bacterium]|nr:hypothetical protein [Spartobacteria bacterium]
MNLRKLIAASLLVVVAISVMSAHAKEGKLPIQFINRVRVEYDDNINQTDKDAKSSFKIIEEPEISANLNFEQTFLSLRYRPALVWWEKRDSSDDKTDIHHDVDAIFNHRFTPRLTLSIQDTFRYAERPELIEDGTVLREKDTFKYNSLNGTLSVLVRPDLRMDLGGRWIILRYDEDDVAKQSDYDQYVGGLSVRHQIVQNSALSADFRYEDTKYKDADSRDSKSTFLGLGLEQIFSPNLLGSLRAGWQHKDYDKSFQSKEDAPYGEASLTFVPSPATRISAGASYAMTETDVYPYTGQNRASVFASFAYDITARIAWYLSGSYGHGDYDGQDLPDDATVGDLPVKQQQQLIDQGAKTTDTLTKEYADSVKDGKEKIGMVSSRLTYKLNRNNWLEAGWQYTNVDSDMRENYERNRVHLGWKISL